MPFRIKVSLVILAVLLALAVTLPLVLPIGPAPDTRPLAEVAGPDAEYVSVAGIDMHVRRWAGPDIGPTFMLLHGFPYSTHTFDVLAPLLAERGDVVAVDLPGFGFTERPEPDDPSVIVDPYAADAQPVLVAGLLDRLGVEEAVVVGHGYGARVALDTALARPEIVAGLVTIGASPYVVQQRSWLSRLVMSTPQMQRLGPVFLRPLAAEQGERLLWAGWYDPTAITDELEAAFFEPFTVDGWDVALWRLSQAESPDSLAGRLGSLTMPVLVVAGAEDGIVPVEQSERLAAELPNADLVQVAECGHAVQEECPEELAAAVNDWLAE